MNKAAIVLGLFAWSTGTGVYAQPYQKTDYGIRSTVRSVNIEVQFYSPFVVRVLKSPEGTTFTKQSLSVIQVLQKTTFRTEQNGDELFLETERIHASLNLKNGEIA
jgi:alpha-D-xyloside xylohydrolase